MNAAFKPEDVGRSIQCARCRGEHVLIRPNLERSTADRNFVYVMCRGQLFFEGQVVERTPNAVR